jgi:hypothetical protein
MRKYTIVTVAFEGDIELMSLQARSMKLYSDPSLIEEIIVVDNFTGQKSKRWEENLLNDYGHMAQKVRIVPAAEIANTHELSGWYSQQVLKLAVAKIVGTDRFLVLDAKNHLIKPLTRDFLETPEGKTRINGYGYSKHPLRLRLENTCSYLKTDVPLDKFVRTSTPFTMITSVAKSIVRNIEKDEKCDFALAMSKHGFTEFFLYAATLAKVGVLDDLYDWNQPFSPDIWTWGAQDLAVVEKAVNEAKRDISGPFFSVHRGAIRLLFPVCRDKICELWTERSLFQNTDEAYEFLSTICD